MNANLALEYSIVAISLVLLTGWVGQISLGQGSFVGIGAFSTGLIARGLHIPFPANLPLAATIGGASAALLGMVALRVRGLYLAVATLIFAWMADAYLFSSSWFVGTGGASTIPNTPAGRPGTVTAFDLSNKRVFFYAALAALAATWFLVQNLRDSKTGRAFFAVRGSETAAVSLGIDVTRYKLMAFATSGALAGVAGNLMMTDLRTVSPVTFQFTFSLFILSIAVVGGIMSLGGAVAASVLFAALNEVFFRVSFLNGWLDVVSVALLFAVLLGYPGGLGALGRSLAARLRARARPLAARPQVLPPTVPSPTALSPAGGHTTAGPSVAEPARADWRSAEPPSPALPRAREDRPAVLEAQDITVRFGGLTAVSDVALSVREHEIVGLIGPNGAGKTTLFNAISGLNQPAGGRIRLFGRDATGLPVHVRARMGVGRTFQLIQLFPQLSVFDNLLVATHVHNPTGILAHLALTPAAVAAERDAHRRVREVIGFLGLEEVAARPVAGLPFGVLRRVEIARALVTEAPLLMLDEPASGLDNTETEDLIRLLRFIRGHLGLSILLIEHDVRMVTSICDYIYVINRGAPLAEGTSAEIQRHPEVVAAYLGKPEAAPTPSSPHMRSDTPA